MRENSACIGFTLTAVTLCIQRVVSPDPLVSDESGFIRGETLAEELTIR